MKLWLGSALVSASLALPGIAAACSFAPQPIHEIDTSIEDSSPPGPVSAVQSAVSRGIGPTQEVDCSESSTSCDDIGTIVLTVTPPQDDQTPREELGYVLEFVDGKMPEGLSLPVEPVRLELGGTIGLIWLDGATDDQEPFSFTLRVTAMDKAGNLGETSEAFLISDKGSDEGCATVSGGSGGSLVTFLALGLWIAWRRRSEEV